MAEQTQGGECAKIATTIAPDLDIVVYARRGDRIRSSLADQTKAHLLHGDCLSRLSRVVEAITG